jgi:RimJ/RimL family protein N-acetyltransferase
MKTGIQYPAIHLDGYTLRMATGSDAEKFMALVNNNLNRVSPYFPGIVKFCGDLSVLKTHLEERALAAAEGRYTIMVIEDNSNGSLVGVIQLKDIDENAAKREFGAFMDETYGGKGVMTKALSKIIDHGFNSLQLNKVFLRTAQTNTRSRRLAEKTGFVQEGLLRQDFRTSGGDLMDAVYYGLLKEDWNKKTQVSG